MKTIMRVRASGLKPLVTMWERLMKLLEGRVSAHMEGLHAALSLPDPESRIKQYCKWRNYNARAVREMTAAWRKAGGEPDRGGAILY